MGKFFLKKIFTPSVYVQNDQRVMGFILRYACWGSHGPPPATGGPRRLTGRPTYPPPPPDPKSFRSRLGVNIQPGQPPLPRRGSGGVSWIPQHMSLKTTSGRADHFEVRIMGHFS